MDDSPIATPLGWLKAEIDRSIGQSRAALARGAGTPAGAAESLQDAERSVRQVRGALQMLSLEGAARYCAALEQSLSACRASVSRLNHVSAALLDRSLFALSQFLDDLAQGEPDVPLKLFPLYRELGELCERGDIGETELFYPDVTPTPARARAGDTLDAEQRSRYVSGWRAQYQRGLLAWLKQPADSQALQSMRAALEALDLVADQLDAPPGLWWSATGLVDLAEHGAAADERAAYQSLLSRLERLMRDVAAGAANEAAAFLRELLYPLALAAPASARVQEIKSLYRLDAQIPEFCVSGTLEYDVSALAPVLQQMRQRLAAIEDAWAKYTAGSSTELRRMREQTNALKAVARDLGHYRLVRLLDIVTLIATKLPEAYPASNDVLALEMAAAFLFMEGMLESFTNPPADIDQQVAVMVGWLLDAVKPRGAPSAVGAPRDDITQRRQFADIRAQVAREILTNLRSVEQTVDEIARDHAQCARITGLEAPVRQMAGALKMLGLSRANGVLSACLHLMKLSVSDDPALTRSSLEWVADGLSCLGFYLENLRQGEQPNEAILLGFVQRLSRDDAQPAGSTGWIAATSEDSGAAPSAPAAGASGPRPRGDEGAQASQGDDSDAEDLRVVYLQEARSILGELLEPAARLHADAADMTALAEARRGFHTLKGGARLVGFKPIAGLAWEVEQTLSAHHAAARPVTAEVMILLREAIDVLAESLPALAQGDEPDERAFAELGELAAALRDPGEPHEALREVVLPPDRVDQDDVQAGEHTPPTMPAASVERLVASERGDAATPLAAAAADPGLAVAGPQASGAASADIAVGSIRMSRTLFGIYMREGKELLHSLDEEIERLAQAPGPAVLAALLRIAHTLCSTASTLGFEAVAELAATLEEVLHELPATNTAARECMAALRAARASFAAMLSEVEAQREPQRDADTLARLDGLRATRAQLPAQNQASERERFDARLLPLFLDEASQLLPRLQRELANWQHDRAARDCGRELARCLHTFKGSARMAGAARLGEAAHALEGRVETALGSGALDDGLAEELQASLDALAEAVDELGLSAASLSRGNAPEARAREPAREPGPVAAPARQRVPPVRVDADTLDRLVAQAGEIGSARLRMQNELEALRQSLDELTDSAARLRVQLRETQVQADSQLQSRLTETGRAEHGFDPLELDRYTRLQELTRMMAESLHDVQMIQNTLLANSAETEAALALQARAARELQQRLIDLRSMPFAMLAPRLQRTVRQTARELDRKAELVIEGEDMELDRSILQRLAAPLEHMLRNAVSHGIEAPGRRLARGKPESGRILVRLEQQGIEALLTLADDGAGLDLAAIREQALRMGLLAEDEEVNESKLVDLVFAPGLSTADEVSETAGRGVGLDVARAELAALGGSTEVDTVQGSGTSFRIRLPLSLAASQVLLVRAGEATYAIPAALVENVAEVPAAELERAYVDGMLALEAASYPLYYLPRLIGMEPGSTDVKRPSPVLLLRSGEHRIALHVDGMLRQHEAVLKPLGPQLARVPGLVGATLLGNNQVVLVVNPLQWCALARVSRMHSGLVAARNAAVSAEAAHILVVDDSLTVRRLTSRLLARAGYQVASARDGLEALGLMRTSLPDLVVLDLEMPRMDGFELMRQMRADARTAAVPIVVVSSRLAEKHQRRAAEAGADAFFGKPYPEDELLACIGELLDRRAAARAA